MQTTSIQWTDLSANLLKYRRPSGTDVWACVKVSDGCKGCYAEAMAHRFKRGGPFSLQTTKAVTPYFCEATARKLLRSKKLAGQKVFISDMTDLFGEWVPFDIIDQHFAVFALRPDVTFQILTKRPERMAEYFNKHFTRHRIGIAAVKFSEVTGSGIMQGNCDPSICNGPFPLPNVWLGISAENLKTLDQRAMQLSACPAAVHFWSLEPLLEDLGSIRGYLEQNVDLVIVGGESGHGARPCDVEWIRSIVRECKAAGVPCFVKQLGSRPVVSDSSHAWGGATMEQCEGPGGEDDYPHWLVRLSDHKGGDPDEWPEDLRVRQFPELSTPATGAGE